MNTQENLELLPMAEPRVSIDPVADHAATSVQTSNISPPRLPTDQDGHVPRTDIHDVASTEASALNADSREPDAASDSTASVPAPQRASLDIFKVDGTSSKAEENVYGMWKYEIASCVSAVAALLAIFITLYLYTNRPSPQWPRVLSLNTIVAILTVLLKTNVLFVVAEGIGQLKWAWFTHGQMPLQVIVKYDDASRGALGASVLIWRLRTRDLLASLRALITMLALIVDPFAQQLIRYYDCQVPRNQTAEIPRTNHFQQLGAIHAGANRVTTSAGIQSALNAGVFSPQPNPMSECSTGNCTWSGIYSTIAWCSQCDDISAMLEFNNATVAHGAILDSTNATTSLNGGISVTMPVALPLWEFAAIGASPFTSRSSSTDLYAFNGEASVDSILGKNLVSTTDRTVPRPGPYVYCSRPGTSDLWTCRGYGAARCKLFPCTKSFTASVKSGTLTENLTESAANWGYNAATDSWSSLDTTCINDEDKQSMSELGVVVDLGQKWSAFNASVLAQANFTRPLAESLTDRGCLYNVEQVFVTSLPNYLQTRLFSGVVTGPNAGLPGSSADYLGPEVIKSIFNYGNVTFDRIQESFANISTSFTNYVRENGNSSYSNSAKGVAMQKRTCVSIRWGWLAYPIALVASTILFLLLILRATRPSATHPRIWKSSPLALLYHGFENDQGGLQEQPYDVNSIKGMTKLAKATSMRLTMAGETSGTIEMVANVRSVEEKKKKSLRQRVGFTAMRQRFSRKKEVQSPGEP